MADLNDFLNKLGIGNPKQPQVENSPLDMSRLASQGSALQAPLEQPVKPMAPAPVVEAEPMHPEPPVDEEIQLGPPSVGPQDIESEIQMAAKDSGIDLSQPEVSEQSPASPLQQKQSLMERYIAAQKGHQDNLQNLGYLQGGNQIAQAIASGYGGKIGAGEEAIKGLKDASESRVKGIEGEADMSKKSMGLDEAEKMADPGSDISEFYRQQAYAMLKKLKPDEDYSGKLDNMSAAQLQKIPGLKNMMAPSQSPWIATDRVDGKGNPIRFNKVTGEYSLADGSIIKPGDYTARDILRKDQLTGNYGIGNVGAGMRVLPTNYSAATKSSEPNPDGTYKEITYSDVAKAAPQQAEKLDKVKTAFANDVKEARDTATSVTNLSTKLASGDSNGAIDSGMLGSIQTQAAKMAGQKGVLTDQDLKKFAGAGGWKAAADRAVANAAEGKMSREDIEFFKLFNSKMGKSLEQDIENRSKFFIDQGKQLVATTHPNVSDEDVYKMLSVDKVAPIVQDKPDAKIEEYAKNNKLTYEQAQAILTKRGYTPNGK